MPKSKFEKIKKLNEQATKAKKAGNHREAMSKVNQALELDNRNVYSHNNKGNILLHFNNHVGALASFKRALKLNPGDEYAQRKITQLASEQQKKHSALVKQHKKQQISTYKRGSFFAVSRDNGRSGSAIYKTADGASGLAQFGTFSSGNRSGLFGVKSEVKARLSRDGNSIEIDHDVEARFGNMSLGNSSSFLPQLQ